MRATKALARLPYKPQYIAGNWYVYQPTTRAYVSRIPYKNEQECYVECLKEWGRDASARIDALGAYDANDPHGYLA
jgi:hypothetical protein